MVAFVNLIGPEAVFVARLLLGFIFFFSAVLKIPDLKGFSRIVMKYGILPFPLARLSAHILPFAEMTVGILLLTGIGLRIVAIASFFLMLINTFFVFTALVRKIKMENCGCYGTAIKVPLSWSKLFENIVWLLIAAYLIVVTSLL
ncbi:MAG: MauE/DoxX family redox-associated membrane protein [Candidatus Woesearchaeota archaeon]